MLNRCPTSTTTFLFLVRVLCVQNRRVHFKNNLQETFPPLGFKVSISSILRLKLYRKYLKFIFCLFLFFSFATSRVDAQTVVVFSIDQPGSPLSADAGPDQAYDGEPIALGGSPTATGSNNEFFYYWWPEASLNDNSVANPILSDPEGSTLFFVEVFSEDYLCSVIDSVFVEDMTVGVNDDQGSFLELFPNPFDDALRFKSEKKIKEIIAFGVGGNMVNSWRKGGVLSGIIDTSALNEGFYLFIVTSTDGHKKSLKLCKFY